MKNFLLKKGEAVLVVVDMQERLMPAMSNREIVTEKCSRLIKGCRVLGTDIIVTQQYTKGIGPTVPEIEEALTAPLFDGEIPAASYEPVEKTDFSAMREPAFRAQLEKCGKKQVILCGVEGHICVEQTCAELIGEGYEVFVPYDCISSRDPENAKMSIERMRDMGAAVIAYESVLYELMGSAREAGFKKISRIVK